jgi:hypothetical protein
MLLLPLLLAALLSAAVSQSNAATDWYCVAAPGLADGPLCVYLSVDPCLQRLGINVTYNSLPIINAAIDGVNPQRICRNLDANGLCQACLAFNKVSISGTGARICPTVVQRCASIDLVTTPLQCVAFGNGAPAA